MPYHALSNLRMEGRRVVWRGNMRWNQRSAGDDQEIGDWSETELGMGDGWIRELATHDLLN